MSLEQLEPIRAMLRARRGETLSIAERRARFEAQAAAAPLPKGVGIADAADGSGRWIEPAGADPGRLLVWLHGGAFMLGSPASWTGFAARVAIASGVRLFLPDYPLAPEHPLPAALDAVTALVERLIGEGLTVALGGDSAGANLAVAAVQHMAGPRPCAVWLLSPYLDLTHSGASIARREALDPFVDPATMPATAATYLAGADPADPRASPLFGPVEHFPPTLIQVGSDEVLFDDARRFADRLGDICVFQQWVGMIHCWPLFPVEEGDHAIAQGAAFVRRSFANSPPARGRG